MQSVRLQELIREGAGKLYGKPHPYKKGYVLPVYRKKEPLARDSLNVIVE
jgi:hypothetical protein